MQRIFGGPNLRWPSAGFDALHSKAEILCFSHAPEQNLFRSMIPRLTRDSRKALT